MHERRKKNNLERSYTARSTLSKWIITAIFFTFPDRPRHGESYKVILAREVIYPGSFVNSRVWRAFMCYLKGASAIELLQ